MRYHNKMPTVALLAACHTTAETSATGQVIEKSAKKAVP